MSCRFRLLLFACLFLGGCVRIPEGITPVTDFDAGRYLGQWYEIARLDHSFERELTRVTATYSRRDDGGIRVLNKGYNSEKGEWEEAEGKAFFVEDTETGFLKVSFFGPFYGSYIIFELDTDYQYAFVSGPDRSYLWFLSRTPQVSEEVRQEFLGRTGELGFETGQLIWVDQAPLP